MGNKELLELSKASHFKHTTHKRMWPCAKVLNVNRRGWDLINVAINTKPAGTGGGGILTQVRIAVQIP